MRDSLDEIEKRGATLVVVGSGKPHHAKWFAEDLNYNGPILADPDLVAYRAAKLRRGYFSLLSPATLAAAMRAFRGGFRQTRTRGDPWQNGGVFVLAPGDRVLFEQRSAAAGDHARVSEILAALVRNR
ncbi:MAG: hypothetical protein KJ042_10450 [Deltaproteobacteria bacterium]|nr:hypothetical protein [Deltaproteobacteria bacterium]